VITGEIKGEVDRVRDAFWACGISNSDEVPPRPTPRTADKRVTAGRPDAVGV
jgi:hypothetical protein